jgi:hypothetical protein
MDVMVSVIGRAKEGTHMAALSLDLDASLDRKGLLYVGGALVYVESPIKVDSFFLHIFRDFYV